MAWKVVYTRELKDRKDNDQKNEKNSDQNRFPDFHSPLYLARSAHLPMAMGRFFLFFLKIRNDPSSRSESSFKEVVKSFNSCARAMASKKYMRRVAGSLRVQVTLLDRRRWLIYGPRPAIILAAYSNPSTYWEGDFP